jgi:hypothetical protein
MAGYLELAEAAIHKEGKTYILNIYNELFAVAMPAEFRFDMAIMCGPKWTVGEHKLDVTVKANENGEVKNVVEGAEIKIAHEDMVYHAVLNNVKFTMNYDVKYLTFTVFDNDEEVISRVYPVRAMLYPRQPQQEVQSEQSQEEPNEENKKDKKKKKD